MKKFKKDNKSIEYAAMCEIEAAKNAYDNYAMEECLEQIENAMNILQNADDSNYEIGVVAVGTLDIKFNALEWLGRFAEAEGIAFEMVKTADKHQDLKMKVFAYNKK